MDMRKYLVLSLVLLLAVVGMVSASTKYHRMHGEISSIDAATQSFTIKHDKENSTFKTDNSTKFRGAGKVIGFADLQVGDDARVSFTEKGSDKTAARVDVVHGKKKS
jgi:hypothetical protein